MAYRLHTPTGMKCYHHIIIPVLLPVLLLLPAQAWAEDLWSMKELTVLAFDSEKARVEEDEDQHGVRIIFSEWNSQLEEEIRSTLGNSNIEYRLFPGRQSAMTVELYSNNASLKFSSKEKKRTVQIIVGNTRPEREALEALMDPDSAVPLPANITSMLRKGEVGEARKELYKVKATLPEQKNLLQNQITVLEASLRDSVAVSCNDWPRNMNTPEAIESVFLLSWCHFSKREVVRAEQILSDLSASLYDTPENKEANDKIRKRIEQHRRKILVFSLLDYARTNSTAILNNTFAQFASEFINQFFSVNLLEIVGDHLLRMGMGGVLSGYADTIMAKLSNEQLRNAAPILAESYLNAGQYVRAQDIASYFLEKPLPSWAQARLIRVRAHVNMQEGNWTDAAANFAAANQLSASSPADELALMEATIRMEQTPQTEYTPPETDTTAIDKYRRRYAARLHAEATLASGKPIPSEILMSMPDYTLYFALRSAESKKNNRLAGKISALLADRNGSWAALAKMDGQIKQMKSQLEKLKKEQLAP